MLSHGVILCLRFWGTGRLFSIAAAQLYIPTSNVWRYQFLYILTNSLFSLVLHCYYYYYNYYYWQSCGTKCYLIVVLIFLLLMTDDGEHIFLFLLAICVSPLEKYLFNSATHFFNLSFCCSVVEVSCIIWILSPYEIHNVQIFSPFCRLSFYLLDNVLWYTSF